MKTTITYFVHSTTTDNERDLATGWHDGVLSHTSEQQARDLGSLVSDQLFDAVFCSDLKRAIVSHQAPQLLRAWKLAGAAQSHATPTMSNRTTYAHSPIASNGGKV